MDQFRRDTGRPPNGGKDHDLARPLLPDLLSVRQFAIAVIAAVLLQALLVRPVVLPAAVGLLGRHAWWPTHTQTPAPPGPRVGPPAAPPRCAG